MTQLLNKGEAMPNFLITGCKSGLGRHLFECFNGIGLARETPPNELERLRREGAEVIIHCAAQPPRAVTNQTLFPFLDDNVLLTLRMVQIPHKKFIFISSVDVYPQNNQTHDEEEIIPVESVPTFYAASKLMSESIVQRFSKNYLILRCAAFLGVHSRKNSLIRIAEEDNCVLSLSPDSTFNCVRHAQVAELLRFSLEKDLKGIFNVASVQNLTLREIADIFGKKVIYGSYRYDVGQISNRKVSSLLPTFKQTSRQVVEQFIQEDLPKRKVLTSAGRK